MNLNSHNGLILKHAFGANAKAVLTNIHQKIIGKSQKLILTYITIRLGYIIVLIR